MSNVIKVLAIDDEDYMLKILNVCLKKPDFEIETSSDAMSAMTLYKGKHYDIILLDVVMPGITGLELLSLIRSTDQDTPVIMLTAKVEDNNGALLKRISGDKNTYYQSKNFTKDELVGLVTRIVREVRSSKVKADYFKEMEQNVALAGEVQQFMFPKWSSIQNNAQLSFFFLPYMNITGDIFNVSEISDGVFLSIAGDISGHGIQAALYMAALNVSLEQVLRKFKDGNFAPHDVLNHLQGFMRDIAGERYMTCIASIIDFNRNKVFFQSAGHPDFLIFSPSQGRINPNPDNIGTLPVGMDPDAKYSAEETVEVNIPDDAIMFFMTDGLADLQDSIGNTYKIDPLEEFVGTFAKSGLLPSTIYKIVDAVFRLGYNDIKDDISISAISKLPAGTDSFFFYLRPVQLEVDGVAQQIAQRILEKTSNDELSAKIEVAASEFMNNIILHGYAGRSIANQTIAVNLKFSKDGMDLTFWDKAKEWDMQSSINKDEVVSDILNIKKSGSGRGMAIIKSVVTSILRKRYADVLNETTLSVKY